MKLKNALGAVAAILVGLAVIGLLLKSGDSQPTSLPAFADAITEPMSEPETSAPTRDIAQAQTARAPVRVTGLSTCELLLKTLVGGEPVVGATVRYCCSDGALRTSVSNEDGIAPIALSGGLVALIDHPEFMEMCYLGFQDGTHEAFLSKAGSVKFSVGGKRDQPLEPMSLALLSPQERTRWWAVSWRDRFERDNERALAGNTKSLREYLDRCLGPKREERSASRLIKQIEFTKGGFLAGGIDGSDPWRCQAILHGVAPDLVAETDGSGEAVWSNVPAMEGYRVVLVSELPKTRRVSWEPSPEARARDGELEFCGTLSVEPGGHALVALNLLTGASVSGGALLPDELRRVVRGEEVHANLIRRQAPVPGARASEQHVWMSERKFSLDADFGFHEEGLLGGEYQIELAYDAAGTALMFAERFVLAGGESKRLGLLAPASNCMRVDLRFTDASGEEVSRAELFQNSVTGLHLDVVGVGHRVSSPSGRFEYSLANGLDLWGADAGSYVVEMDSSGLKPLLNSGWAFVSSQPRFNATFDGATPITLDVAVVRRRPIHIALRGDDGLGIPMARGWIVTSRDGEDATKRKVYTSWNAEGTLALGFNTEIEDATSWVVCTGADSREPIATLSPGWFAMQELDVNSPSEIELVMRRGVGLALTTTEATRSYGATHVAVIGGANADSLDDVIWSSRGQEDNVARFTGLPPNRRMRVSPGGYEFTTGEMGSVMEL